MASMIKQFVNGEAAVREVSKGTFAIDDAWLADAVELAAVKPGSDTKKKWKAGVWEGAPLVHPSTPNAHVMVVLHLQVGRGRRNRYVISDGKVWADVYGSTKKTHYTKRAWMHQSGPWKMVQLVQAKPLTLAAQMAIQPAIDAFMHKAVNKKVKD